MALVELDRSEDRNFAEGETIYDVDGNAYTVRNNKAVLNVENTTVSYFLGRTMRECFSRKNPRT